MKPKIGRRQQVLGLLREAREPKTVNELARIMRVHGNTVRFHLESLMADGLIEVEEQNETQRPVGRPAVRYRAVARVAPSQMKHTETLVKLFLRDLSHDPEGVNRAENIGRGWGKDRAQQTEVPTGRGRLHPNVRALTTLLNDMGFESDPPTQDEILVKTCPFLDNVEIQQLRDGSAPDLPPVCAVHLGVMKGALEEWEADVDVDELTPFARVDRCQIALKYMQ